MAEIAVYGSNGMVAVTKAPTMKRSRSAINTDKADVLHAARSLSARQALRYRYHASLALVDGAALIISFCLAGFLRTTTTISSGLALSLLVVPLALGFALNNGSYSYQALVDWRHGLSRIVSATMQALVVIVLVAFGLQGSEQFSRLVLATGFILAPLSLAIGRRMVDWRVRKLGQRLLSRLVIVDGVCLPLPGDVKVVNAADAGLQPNPRDPMMLNRLGHVVRGADFVLVCCAVEHRANWVHLLKGVDVPSHVLMPEFDSLGGTIVGRFDGHTTMQISNGVLDLRERFQKRVLDLALTVPAIILLSPLFILFAVAIKLDSNGPILFRQERLGRGNRLFKLYKFRSMYHHHSDASGHASTQRSDARVTRVGRIMRGTSIDELPQLLNVLSSDMSLVGPRPHALGSLAGLEPFWDVDQRYWHRHVFKPGLTGLAQIRGYRGATHQRNDLLFRLKSDLEYFERWSIWRDVGIILSTFRVLVHRNAF